MTNKAEISFNEIHAQSTVTDGNNIDRDYVYPYTHPLSYQLTYLSHDLFYF